MSQCWGTQINNIGYIPNILQMNTWISNGYVLLGELDNGHTEAVGSIANDFNYLLKIQAEYEKNSISGVEATRKYMNSPYFSKSISGFIQYKGVK